MTHGAFVESLKHLATRSSPRVQSELKRYYFARHIARGTFTSDEPEYLHLPRWLDRGDWALDLGANVGHFTLHMARLTGSAGRVIAVEPVLHTFALLTANVVHASATNVTLLNIAASDHGFLAGLSIPGEGIGDSNYYRSHLDTSVMATHHAVALPLGSLPIDHRISLIKIDVEGHEGAALQGIAPILSKDQPFLIVEGRSLAVSQLLSAHAYEAYCHPDSPNRVYCGPEDPRADGLLSLGYQRVGTDVQQDPTATFAS